MEEELRPASDPFSLDYGTTFAKNEALERWRQGGDRWPAKVRSPRYADTHSVKGCITEIRYLLGKTPSEMETIVGLPKDELIEGAVVMVLAHLPISHEDFEPWGSTITPAGEQYDPDVNPEYRYGSGVAQWNLVTAIPVSRRIPVKPWARFELQEENLSSNSSLRNPANPDGGVSGSYPERERLQFVVAPAAHPGGKEKNTLRMELVPVACWRINDIRFGNGRSFVEPECVAELTYLGELIRAHPGAPLSIFGHADAVGHEGANKALSGERAAVIYGLLTRNISLWENIYSRNFGDEDWGQRAVKTMLATLGSCAETSEDMESHGWRKAVRKFQSENGLPETGQVNKTARAQLFLQYMSYLCGPHLWLKPADFLAQGKDPDGRGDYQGCGEFNPILRPSAEEEAVMAKAGDGALRDEFYAPNRRVVVILFRPGTVVPPEKWPCPGKSECSNGCRKRFWSDHSVRRTPTEVTRWYDETKDTFSCRFYDRIVGGSPCERAMQRRILQLYLQHECGLPIANERYELEIEGQLISSGSDRTDSRGMLEHKIKFGASSGVLRILHHRWDLEIDQPPPYSNDKGVRVRLGNLGFLPRASQASLEDVHFARRGLVDLCGGLEVFDERSVLSRALIAAHYIRRK